MKAVFLPEAAEDIERLYSFLADRNPLAAQKAMLAIDEGVQMLKDSPFIGVRMEHQREVRQLFVPFGKSAYVLRYRVIDDSDTLLVIRVWHGRERRS